MKRYERIAQIIKEHNYKRIAEVGVREGETAKYLLTNCNLEKYYLVDMSKQHNIPDTGIVKNLICLSNKAATLIPNKSLDLVFIDADHKYESVMQDLALWFPKIKEGGIICGHDYKNPAHRGVERAVKDFFKLKINEDLTCYVFWGQVK